MSLLGDRMRRVTRLFLIVVQLQSGKSASLATLATICGCCRRTVTRDLTYLQEAGIPLHYDAARRTYVIEPGAQLLSVPFTLPEIIAIVLAKDAMLSEAGAEYQVPLRSAFERITSLMPKRFRNEIAGVSQAVSFHAGTHRDYSQAPWTDLMTAARSHEVLEIDYHALSTDAVTTRRIDPYAIVHRAGFWHVVAYCHLRNEIRTFAVDCIRSARATGQRFQVPPDFTLSAYLQNSVRVMVGAPVDVAIRFEPGVARWARRHRWSFPYSLEETTDGGLVLRGTVAGLQEISREALRWGSGVTVVEPPELRTMLLAEALKIAEKYEVS